MGAPECAIAAAPKSSSSLHLRSGLFFSPCRFFSAAQTPFSSSRRSSRHSNGGGKSVAMAVTKNRRKGGKTPPSRDWSYEHLMVTWDEAFERCCSDPAKASRIRDLASKGVASHGRGCVFVLHEIQTIPRGPGAGFTSKPPRSSRAVPDFITLRWHAAYLPRHFLLDPTMAPIEQDLHLSPQHHSEPGIEIDVDELITEAAAAETILEDDDASESHDDASFQIIDYSEQDAVETLGASCDSPFLIFDDNEDGLGNLPHKEDEAMAIGRETQDGVAETQDPVLKAEMGHPETHHVDSQTGNRMENQVELISQEMLFSAMKGMDVTRLLSLTMNVDYEAEKFRLGSRTAMVSMRTMDAGGEDPYNPELDELVLLLHLVIDKRPAFGADVVIAYKHDMSVATDSQSDSWKLRLKYKL